tara:strand:- start:387 stop:512 length:126 start_codon:yes stop_codon:yes gene_type:complete
LGYIFLIKSFLTAKTKFCLFPAKTPKKHAKKLKSITKRIAA